MNKSPSITNLAVALTKAQAEMPVVKMNSSNPFLKNKYADLGAVIETSRPILAKYELSISQFPTSDADRIGVTSLLIHSSGEWIEDSIFIPASDSKGLSVAQSAGVVISYLRRYSWASVLGLYADEDNDGHTGDKKAEPKQAMTLDQAKKYKDAKGILYLEKTVEDLQNIVNNDKAPADKKEAALLLISEKAGK